MVLFLSAYRGSDGWIAASLASSSQAGKIIGLEKKVAGAQQFRNYILGRADFPKLQQVRGRADFK